MARGLYYGKVIATGRYYGKVEDRLLRTYRISAENAQAADYTRPVPVKPIDLLRMVTEIQQSRAVVDPVVDVLRKKHVLPKPEKPLTKAQQKKLDDAENRRWFEASKKLRRRGTRLRP